MEQLGANVRSQVQAAARFLGDLPPTKAAARFVVVNKEGGFQGCLGEENNENQASICKVFSCLKIEDAEICAAISGNSKHEIYGSLGAQSGHSVASVPRVYDYSNAVVSLVVDHETREVRLVPICPSLAAPSVCLLPVPCTFRCRSRVLLSV